MKTSGTAWRSVDPDYRATVERVCTEKEIQALELCVLLGLSQREAAEKLDTSREAVKDALERAKRKLRKEIDIGAAA